jgi:hypothetical protein
VRGLKQDRRRPAGADEYQAVSNMTS